MLRSGQWLPRLSQPLRLYTVSKNPIRPHFTAPSASRYLSTRKDEGSSPNPRIDRESERKRGQEKLKADPKRVTVDSTTVKAFDASPNTAPGKPDPGVGKELKKDLGVVKDTFSLAGVPRESRVLGLLGTLPYFGTSLSTLYLAWDLHHPGRTGGFTDAFFISHDSARQFLEIVEPLQLGYGAVIISFLGAIHWGLEYAEKSPSPERTRFRYGMGLASSIIAWPTILMPFEFALTSQFMAFIGLYFADSRATRMGWAPGWYATYRFFLTLMVGMAILVSLVGRAKIGQADTLSYSAMTKSIEQKGLEDTTTDWAKLEAEEKRRLKIEKAKQEREEAQKERIKLRKKEEREKGLITKETDDEDESDDNEEDSDEHQDEPKVKAEKDEKD